MPVCCYGFLFSVRREQQAMPAIDFRQVRSLISITEVLDLLGFEAVHSGTDQLRGHCPLHGAAGGNRVFSVHLGKQAFHCFKCGASGNHLDLWAQYLKKPLYEAALELCERAGREVPWLQTGQRRGTRK